MKKILTIVIVISLLTIVLYFLTGKNKFPPVATTPIEETQPRELCFIEEGIPNERGLSDKFTLRMLLDKEMVTGELRLLPAEKDSKVGKFEGTVSDVDKVMMARKVDAIWDTFAEGMNTKEELKLTFGEGTANIGFGEMVDRGDGVYVYKDAENVSYNLQLTDVACGDIN